MKLKIVFCICVLGTLSPGLVVAGANSLSAGITVSYDYDKRLPEESTQDDSRYQRISINPSLEYNYSASPRDTLGIRVAPSIKYDLEESETDWNYNDLLISFSKGLTKYWDINGSNSFLRSDDQGAGEPVGVGGVGQEDQEVQVEIDDSTSAPELSNDPGRNKYWRNDLQLGSNLTYAEGSSIYFGFGYTVLRNDSDTDSYEDYDRYAYRLSNNHQYSPIWSSSFGGSYIVGDFEEADSNPTIVDQSETISEISGLAGNSSSDVEEYGVDVSLNNYSFRNNVLSVSYNYSGSEYEDPLQNDSDVHQGRLTWQKDYSKKLSTTIGAGPSYQKVEGQDSNYGGNGIVSIDYRIKHGSIGFALEKGYDIENFSGTDERGVVDVWDVDLSAGYRLNRDLSLSSGLNYRNEKRDELLPLGSGLGEPNGEARVTEITKDIYSLDLGLSYSFMRFYSASINYTFLRQESDQVTDEYDDHRIVLSLSWSQELLRW